MISVLIGLIQTAKDWGLSRMSMTRIDSEDGDFLTDIVVTPYSAEARDESGKILQVVYPRDEVDEVERLLNTHQFEEAKELLAALDIEFQSKYHVPDPYMVQLETLHSFLSGED